MGFIAAFMEKMIVNCHIKIVESSSGKSRLLLTIIMRSISMKVYLDLPEFSLHFGRNSQP